MCAWECAGVCAVVCGRALCAVCESVVIHELWARFKQSVVPPVINRLHAEWKRLKQYVHLTLCATEKPELDELDPIMMEEGAAGCVDGSMGVQ